MEKFITKGFQTEHLAAVKGELTRRATILGNALRTHLPPGASFIQPQGGYFIWIKLPPGLDGAKLMEFAVAHHKVRFHPGERFGAGLQDHIRLSFSYYDAGDLAVGAQRLGEAMHAMLASAGEVPTVNPSAARESIPTTITTSTSAALPTVDAAAATQAIPCLEEVYVSVHGASGRLGQLIVHAAASKAPTGSAARCKYVGATGRASDPPHGTQVLIDVSQPEGTLALIKRLSVAPTPLPLVIGTTGSLDMEAIRAYASMAPVAICANFSVGVPLLLTMIDSIKGELPAVSIRIMHF